MNTSGIRGSDELHAWQAGFAKCALHARAAGRRAALEAISDEVDALAHHMPKAERNRREIDVICAIEAHRALGFLDAFDGKMSGLKPWEFTRKLVIEPLLPDVREQIRREHAEGFFEALDLTLIDEVGRC